MTKQTSQKNMPRKMRKPYKSTSDLLLGKPLYKEAPKAMVLKEMKKVPKKVRIQAVPRPYSNGRTPNTPKDSGIGWGP